MTNYTGKSAHFGKDTTANSGKTVSIEQIRQLEEKIATLNEQIATIMHRSLETQEQIVEGHAQALKESQIVQSDETLGWKMSFIEAPLEASKLFTPNAKQLTASA